MRPSRRCLVVVVAAAALAGLAGCSPAPSSGPDPVALKPLFKDRKNVLSRKKSESAGSVEQDAIQAVLDQSKDEFKAKYATLSCDSPPADVAKALNGYVEAMAEVDLKGCPLEFKSAWGKHLKAWRVFVAAVAAHPPVYDDVEFMEMLQHLFGGNADKAKSLGGDITIAARRVIATRNAVYTVAESNGVVARDGAE